MPKSNFSTKLMGNIFYFTAIGNSENEAQYYINLAIGEIRRIEDMLSTYKDHSVVNLINENAGIRPIEAPLELIELVKRSRTISDITQGAFDITYGSIDKDLWNFNKEMTALPSKEKIKESISLINYQNIMLDEVNQTIFLKNKGMRIGFGGIGKGYAAEQAKTLLIQNNCPAGVINASGDMTVWGKNDDEKKWSIAISHPDDKQKILATLYLDNQAIATSGDYEKYVIIDGRRYSHTINPKTGYPIQGIKSTTIISKSAELSDALTTPVMIMGVQAGMHLVNQLPNVEAIIVDDKNNVSYSKNISPK
jgi:FAD:protein FMN transferase